MTLSNKSRNQLGLAGHQSRAGYFVPFAVAILLLSPGLCLAASAQLENLAHFEDDPALYYALRAALAIDITGILLLLYLLFFQKNPFARTGSKILMGLALIVFPAVTLAIGNLVALENAKKVRFCNSCHKAMEVYVADMRDPNNYTISAEHYKNRWINQNQCYGCHTGYGVLGSLNAKMKGLNDVYKYYTGTWKSPIQMKAPFPNKDCLKCHGQAVSFRESKAHAAVADKMLADKILCSKCHKPMHGRKETRESKNEGGFF